MLPQVMQSNEQKYMWNHAGTTLLISIWSDSSVQKQLTATLRNQPVWDAIGRYLTKKGFRVSGKQCRTRIKNLLVRYREIKKKSSHLLGSGIEAFYDAIDRVMKNKTLSTVVSTVSQSIQKVSADSELAELVSRDCRTPAGPGDRLAIKTEVGSPRSECSIPPMQEASSDVSRFQNFLKEVDMGAAEQTASPGSSAASHVPPSHHDTAASYQLLERTVLRLLEAQSTAVSSVLAAQNDFLLKVLEADRERHARLESKLDRILERLERVPGTAQETRLARLLDRLEWLLPAALPRTHSCS
ncbi:uncharacterized protein LOC134540112 isoform X2 [Bacillus rossius redtenbacheri]|uniref:uncharacterized protein LOC134540112 isoform X2 n=1 Tax=Bacillus rossius redtenbacheri TaxID=93214 RepID=UPI002FDEFC4D